MSNVLNDIKAKTVARKKMLAVLVDPDKCCSEHAHRLLDLLKCNTPDFIFMGGSQLRMSFEALVEQFKTSLQIPVVIFPGDVSQFSFNADALLFLSLLSGRNPEYLIGQHVRAAGSIRKSGLETIPTAYLLIDGGQKSAVEYISNTQPIPRTANEIAVSTALAGQMLGMQLVYLEAGSGAQFHVNVPMISEVKKCIDVPLIVGGGIRTSAELSGVYTAGADLVVVGNVLEKHPDRIVEMISLRDAMNE